MIGFISSALTFGVLYASFFCLVTFHDYDLKPFNNKYHISTTSTTSTTRKPVRYVGHNTSMADDLFDKVKIVCILVTISRHHVKKAMHVKNTWGKRCNKIVFATSKKDSRLGLSAAIRVKNSRKLLWPKTRESFKYAHKHHFNDGDWFLKADDDT